MKRSDLIRQLEAGGFVFERHGGSHDIYVKGSKKETIPILTPVLSEPPKAGNLAPLR